MKAISHERWEFGRVPRYEKTLKERLEAGEVMRHSLNGRQIASMRKDGGEVVMDGISGRHRLNFKASTGKRIEDHWTFFKEINDKMHENISKTPSR